MNNPDQIIVSFEVPKLKKDATDISSLNEAVYSFVHRLPKPLQDSISYHAAHYAREVYTKHPATPLPAILFTTFQAIFTDPTSPARIPPNEKGEGTFKRGYMPRAVRRNVPIDMFSVTYTYQDGKSMEKTFVSQKG